MNHMTINESDDDMVSKDQTGSASTDEGSCGGGSRGGAPTGVLKKGPWTSAEDAILVDYVKKHGEGNWNAVQKNSGLFRCGKSCRLRWANHLRPNLKKGAFTLEEEQLIMELHAKMGNKWARMAAHLPGRTDNEIKNYWNTRIKRRQRSGLPLYPPEVCFQAMNGGQQDQNFSELASSDAQQHSLLQTNGYDIPDVVFDNLKASHSHLSYAPAFPHISRSGILCQGASSQNYNVVPPSVHEPMQPQESEAFYPGFLGSVTSGLPTFLPLQNDSFSKIHPSHGMGFTYDPDPNNKNPTPYGGAVAGSHALLNGNLSTSKPFSRAVKLELPSLQYLETDLNSWGTCPAPLSSLETVDAYIQSPALQVLSDYSPPWNSGLLDDVVHRPHGKNQTSESSSSSSIVTPTDVIDSSTLNLNGIEWEDLGGPVSSLGCSAASAFSECTPVGGSLLDKSQPAKEELPDSDITTETAEGVAMLDGGEDISMQLDFPKPDALLGTDCFEQSSDYAKDLAALLSEDFCNDYKHVASGTSSQGCALRTYPWNNMPDACHMPELP